MEDMRHCPTWLSPCSKLRHSKSEILKCSLTYHIMILNKTLPDTNLSITGDDRIKLLLLIRSRDHVHTTVCSFSLKLLQVKKKVLAKVEPRPFYPGRYLFDDRRIKIRSFWIIIFLNPARSTWIRTQKIVFDSPARVPFVFTAGDSWINILWKHLICT